MPQKSESTCVECHCSVVNWNRGTSLCKSQMAKENEGHVLNTVLSKEDLPV